MPHAVRSLFYRFETVSHFIANVPSSLQANNSRTNRRIRPSSSANKTRLSMGHLSPNRDENRVAPSFISSILFLASGLNRLTFLSRCQSLTILGFVNNANNHRRLRPPGVPNESGPASVSNPKYLKDNSGSLTTVYLKPVIILSLRYFIR